MKGFVLEVLGLLVIYGLFLVGMFWLYKKFNQRMLDEMFAHDIRKRAVGAPDVEIPV